MSTEKIAASSLYRYGFIALPVAFAGFPLYILAPDFYATQYGLSLTLLGSLLLFIRLFDAIQDPLIGWSADNFHKHLFKFVLVAGTLLCVAIYGLFNWIFFSAAIWFFICVVLAVTAYSTLTIVLGVQATLWTQNSIEQTKISSVRECFGLIGLLIAVSTPSLFAQLDNPDTAYLWYSMVLFCLMVIGIFNFSKIVFRSPTTLAALKPPATLPAKQPRLMTSPVSALRALPDESKKLFLVYLVSMFASSIPSVLVIFYVRDFLGAAHMTGLFLLLYFLCGAAAMPLWKQLSIRFGKYKTWCLANVVAVVGFVGAALLGHGDIWLFAMVCILSGLALGADLTLPPSILADQIHANNNRAYAASHYALLAFIVKVSLALASAIVLPALEWVGFRPMTSNSEIALTTLSLAYSVFPCVLKLGAAALLYVFFIQSSQGDKYESRQTYSTNGDAHDSQ